MKKGRVTSTILVILIVLGLLASVFYATYQWQQNRVAELEGKVSDLTTQLDDAKKPQTGETYEYTSAKGVKVKIFLPTKNSEVTSPLVVIGEVPGNWSFEASFPTMIKNSEGEVVTQVAAQVLGDWMTSGMVPFSVTLEYDATMVEGGTLILQKDNPSGLAENDDSVAIPLKFR